MILLTVDRAVTKMDAVLERLDELAKRISAIEARLGVTTPCDDTVTHDDTRALTIPREQARELTLAASNHAYDRIITEFNEKVFPEITRMAQMVQYQSQDSDGMVDAYRRAVESRENISGMLTDGTSDPRVITPHVRLFF